MKYSLREADEIIISEGAKSTPTALLITAVLRSKKDIQAPLPTISELKDLSVREMMDKLAICRAQAIRLTAAFELSDRCLKYEADMRFTRPSDVAFFLMPELSGLPQEHFGVLYLDRKNKIVHDKIHFVGTPGESLVDPATILREAIKYNATSIVLYHNHPSGDPTPSKNDIEITKRMCLASRVLGIEVFDHIIIGKDSFLSLAEKGLM